MREAARIAARSEYARRCDLARGFAGMAPPGSEARERFQRAAAEWHAAACEMDGPLPADVAAMSADDLAAELGL